jgi:transcription elongation factor GreB
MATRSKTPAGPGTATKARETAKRGGPRFISPSGYANLREEIERLWKIERPKVTHEVSEAAALGDRSENAEYIYGKKRLREIDRRLRYLSKLLDSLTVVRFDPSQRGRVFFGAWVTLEDEEGREVRYKLVGPDELDVHSGKVSVDSPMGRALLGKRVDDEVTVQRPKGRGIFTVLDIAYDEADAANASYPLQPLELRLPASEDDADDDDDEDEAEADG